jgi:predicted small lipoprotein YifL
MRMLMRNATLTLAIAFALSACGGAAPTPIPPLATLSDVATDTQIDTPTPEPTQSPELTPVATATPTIAATDTPAAAQTPSGNAGDPTACTDWASRSDFFTGIANKVPFAVYCPVAPSGWVFAAGYWAKPASGGWVTLGYHNKKKTQSVTIGQGNFCSHLATPANCWTSSSDLGAANFGDLSGSLKDLGGGSFAVYVNANTKTGYQIVSSGLSQQALLSIANGMVRIPRG